MSISFSPFVTSSSAVPIVGVISVGATMSQGNFASKISADPNFVFRQTGSVHSPRSSKVD